MPCDDMVLIRNPALPDAIYQELNTLSQQATNHIMRDFKQYPKIQSS
jgi:hypothetical protein